MPDPTLDVNDALASALGGDGPPEARGAAALRLRCRLQPVAGLGGKVMPPTYSGSQGPIYIEEVFRAFSSTASPARPTGSRRRWLTPLPTAMFASRPSR